MNDGYTDGPEIISIIIPVYNEEGVIGNSLKYLKSIAHNELIEIIVSDGGSQDNSVKEAEGHGVTVIQSTRKGRAAQMNEGARTSKGSILYFLHADCLPPSTFVRDIRAAVENGFPMGCFRLRFDLDHWFLRANAWFTRFDINAFRYGDQSLFVKRQYFDKAGGFSENHILMEDNEIIPRLKRHGRFAILSKEVVTSARKYVANGVFKMQAIFYLIYVLYQLGWSQDKLLSIFRNLVREGKS